MASKECSALTAEENTILVEEINYIRLLDLVNDLGLKVIRYVFDGVFPPRDLAKFLETKRNSKAIMAVPLPIRNKLFPSATECRPWKSTDFDMHTMVSLMSNLYDPPSEERNTWYRMTLDQIKVIWETRNFLYHSAKCRISTTDLIEIQNDVTETVFRLVNPCTTNFQEAMKNIATFKYPWEDSSEKNNNERDFKDATPLLLLVLKTGTQVIREVFDKIPIFSPGVLKHTLELNRNSPALTFRQLHLRKMLHPSNIEQKESCDFDLTLLVVLLDNLYKPPQAEVAKWETMKKHITVLKDYRNQLAHLNSTSISTEEFIQIRDNLSEAILGLTDASSRSKYELKIKKVLELDAKEYKQALDGKWYNGVSFQEETQFHEIDVHNTDRLDIREKENKREQQAKLKAKLQANLSRQRYKDIRQISFDGDKLGIYVEPKSVKLTEQELWGVFEKCRVYPYSEEYAHISMYYTGGSLDDPRLNYRGTLGVFIILKKEEQKMKEGKLYALTCRHVVVNEEDMTKQKAEMLYVATKNGVPRELGKLVHYLKKYDMAIIKVTPEFRKQCFNETDEEMEIYDGCVVGLHVTQNGATTGTTNGKVVRDDLRSKDIKTSDHKDYKNDTYTEKKVTPKSPPDLKLNGQLIGVRSYNPNDRAFSRAGDSGALVITDINGRDKAVSMHMAKTRKFYWRQDQKEVTGPLSISFPFRPAMEKLRKAMKCGEELKFYALPLDCCKDPNVFFPDFS